MANKTVIAESDIRASQMGEFWSQVALRKITRENFQNFLEMRKENSFDFPNKQKFLSHVSDISLPAIKKQFNPNEFYKNREGLWVSNGFHERILPVASPVKSVAAKRVPMFDIIKQANDDEIRAQLPKNHVFEGTSAFCAYLAGMISRQPNGEEGNLLNNGYTNIFYVQTSGGVFAVFADWDAGDREWYVYAWSLGGPRWNAGGRVFSSNC